MAPITRDALAKGPSVAERVRRRLPGKLKEIPTDLIGPIAAATLIVVAIQFAIGGNYTWPAFVSTLAVTLVLFIVSFFFGRHCGRVWWPRHGQSLARAVLRSVTRDHRHDIVITGRADVRPTTNRRVFEATALIASVFALVALVLAPTLPFLLAVGFGFPVFFLVVFGGFVLVPHWVFGRLGIRRFDKARFTVEPVTRVYSDRLKISNGTIALIVLAVGGFILRHEGRTDVQAMIETVSLLVNSIVFSLIVAASAVVFYQRRELKVMEDVARYATQLGARDGRGESHEELAVNLARMRPSGLFDDR